MSTSRTSRAVHPFTGAARKPPTLKHRPAIWDAARAFAGVTPERDLRLAKKNKRVRYTRDDHAEPRFGQYVLWVLK